MIIDELIAILGYDVKGEGELDRFNRGLDRAQQRAEKVANRINMMSVAIGTFLGQMAVGFANKIGDTIGSMPSDVLKVGQQFENLETVLTTIEGSSDKAKTSMAWVQDFAATTPYDLNQVSEAFVRMRAYGLDPMSGLLKRVGDASAGMGKSLMQGVEAIADAVTGENERLKEFGIKAKVQGDKITYNWNENGKEMSKTVRKNGPEIIAALTEIFGRFDGAMDKLSKTQGGILSNLGDAWTGFLKKVGDSGYYDYITRKLQGVQDTVERWTKDGTMDRWATAISNGFVRAIQAVERWAKAIGKIGEAVGGRVGQVIADFLRLISGGDIDLSKWQGLAALAGVLLAIFAPMTAIVAGVVLALDDFFAYLTGGESYIGDFVSYVSEAWPHLLDGLSDLFPGVADAISGIRDAFMSADWAGVSRGIVDALTSGFSGIAGIITGYLTSAWAEVSSIDWLGLGAQVANAVVAGLHDIPSAVMALGPSLMLNLMEAFGAIDWGSIGQMLGQNVIPVGAAIVVGILLGVKGLGEALASLVLGIIDTLVNLDWSRLGKAILGVFEGIAKLILGIFVGLGTSIVDTVKAWFDIDLVDVGVRLGRSLLDGLMSVGGSIQSWFASLLPDWAKGWFAEADDRKQVADAGAEVGTLVGQPPAPVVQGAPPPKPVASLAPAKTADPATKILSAGRAAVSAFETAAQVAADRVAAYAAERGKREGNARPGRTSISEEAGRNNAGGMDQLRAMLENMNANLAKMTPEKAVQATVTDARQDNRQFPVTVNSTVNQTVTQASQAPAAAARATSQAVGQAAVPQAGRLAVDSAF